LTTRDACHQTIET